MRWKIKPEPKEGDYRIIKKFLFFPTNIGDDVRWLEYSYIRQQYRSKTYWIGADPEYTIKWVNLEWKGGQ